jgi:3-hydroxyacyl-CoA dehydrogenase
MLHAARERPSPRLPGEQSIRSQAFGSSNSQQANSRWATIRLEAILVRDLVTTRHQDHVLVVTIDNPPVNVLSSGVADGMAAAVRTAQTDDSVAAIVVLGAGSTFVAGADIREFGRIVEGERPMIALNPLFNAIEASGKPVVMALHGNVLGGGLELAMAGHYRIADRLTKLGQPEVKLGLIPGAGGTQRLPRLAGTEAALEMCVFGESIDAKRAEELGLIDSVVEGDLVQAACAFLMNSHPPRRTRDQTANLLSPDQAQALALRVKQEVSRRLRRQTAPLAAVEAICAAASLPFEEGLALEAKLFAECLYGEQSRALIHTFFGERTVSRIPYLPSEVVPMKIKLAGVVGAGTMGSGIAQCYAAAGIPVLLRDADPDALELGMAGIRAALASQTAKGRITSQESQKRLALITPVQDWSGFERCDLMVEAVFEDFELKKNVFAEMDGVARPGAILASNTSTLDIDALASCTRRPGRVVGHHFFSPAPMMKLLEVVRGAATEPEVLVTSMALARRLKKTAVVSRNAFGFIGNRMFEPYRAQAVSTAEEGAAPWDVDQALAEWGMAMGPLAVGDLAGLDVFWRMKQMALKAGITHLDAETFEDRLVGQGRFGQKSGAGWHLYGADRKVTPDPDVEAQLRLYAAEMAIPQRRFTPDQIVERCLDALINEGGRLLEEGVAQRDVDVDIVYVLGYGFPAWRGGPMFYASRTGKGKIHERLLRRYEQYGPFWKPSEWLLA